MQKLKRDDEVIVITGKDKGKRGTISMTTKGGSRYVVSGVNMVKRHIKPNPNAGQAGGIVEKEAPIARSNVAIFNPTTGKADRIGIRVKEDGTKERFFKSNNEAID